MLVSAGNATLIPAYLLSLFIQVQTAVVLQTDPLNAFLRTVVVIPFTTNLRWGQFPFCVLLPAGEGGLVSDSVALCHQVRVADKSRLLRRLGQVSDAAMAKIERVLQVTLRI